jgi:hypothetical protein
MSFARADLTPEAAREDAQLFLLAWDRFIRRMYFDLADPVRDFLYRVYESLPPKEFLIRFLAAAGLATHPDILPPALPIHQPEPIKNRDAPRWSCDYAALATVAVEAVYRYAQGGEPYPEGLHAFEKMLHNFLYLSGPAFVFRLGKKADRAEVEHKLLSEKVSPRFAFAVRLYRARRNFEHSLKWSLVLADPGLASVSAPSLALLSGLSYSYIIKLIKTGRLPARKVEGTWHIPVVDAAKFLAEREDCPEWLRRSITSIVSAVAAAKSPWLEQEEGLSESEEKS